MRARDERVATQACDQRACGLAQEISAQLWRSFSRWGPSRRFTTWMYRVALNTAISWFRAESRRARRLEPGDASLLQVAAPAPDEPDERMAQLRHVIARLPQIDRALLLLYLDGHRHDAIAEVMGVSESNVSTRLHRLKQRLRAAPPSASPVSHRSRFPWWWTPCAPTSCAGR